MHFDICPLSILKVEVETMLGIVFSIVFDFNPDIITMKDIFILDIRLTKITAGLVNFVDGLCILYWDKVDTC